MTAEKLRNIVKLVTVLACVLMFVLVCVVIYQYARLGSLSKKSSSLDDIIAEQKVIEQDLRDGIDRRGSDDYVSQQARERLGMIEKEGEVIYLKK